MGRDPGLRSVAGSHGKKGSGGPGCVPATGELLRPSYRSSLSVSAALDWACWLPKSVASDDLINPPAPPPNAAAPINAANCGSSGSNRPHGHGRRRHA
jgi:hypothetical protein